MKDDSGALVTGMTVARRERPVASPCTGKYRPSRMPLDAERLDALRSDARRAVDEARSRSMPTRRDDARSAAASIGIDALCEAPGVILGAGPSLTGHLEAVREPLTKGWALAVAAPSIEEALRLRGIGTVRLPMVDAPWSIAAYLALRAVGCRTIVLAGLDFAFSDGLYRCAESRDIAAWACELNPFRTIEDMHRAAIGAITDAMESTDRRGRRLRSSAALLQELDVLEALVATDAARGLRTLDLDRHGPSKRGTHASTVAEALPRRQPIDLQALERLFANDEGSSRREVNAGLATRIESGPISIEVKSSVRVAAVVAIDPELGGTGVPRHLDSEFAGRPVLAATLERLGRTRGIERIILLSPSAFDPRSLYDPRRIPVPVEVDACGATPFPPEQESIRASRLWSDTSWRGGINGSCIWDEVFAPAATLAALESRGLDGALLCGADWPLLMIDGAGGAEDLVARFRTATGSPDMVFAPGPPGLCGCVIGRSRIEQIVLGSRRELLGERVDAHPCWWNDPAAIAPVERIRRSMVRAAFDTMRAKLRMRRGIEPIIAESTSGETIETLGGWATVEALENQFFHLPPAFVAQHLVVELNTGRRASGSVSPHRVGSIQRPPMSERLLERLLEEIAAPRDVVVTFGHVGDPLWHPELPRFIEMVRHAGARAVHVRTELVADERRIDAVLEACPDVISVDLNAMTSATYQALMGIGSVERIQANIERVVAASGTGDPRFRRPFVVPRIQRRAESAEEIDGFLERWRTVTGAAVIEGIPGFIENPERRLDTLIPIEPPSEAFRREGARRMVILSDGRVPVCELDLIGEQAIGSVQRSGVFEVWRELHARRRHRGRDRVTAHPDLHWWQP